MSGVCNIMDSACTPALVYAAFSLSGIAVDSFAGSYGDATSKAIVAVVLTLLLDTLCKRGYSTVAWVIVLIPFMLMTLIISMLTLVMGVNPGKSDDFKLVGTGTVYNVV